MRITLFKLCDFYARLEGGKGCLIGIFDSIQSHQFPFSPPTFHICAEAEFEPMEADTQSTIDLVLIDEDGRELLRVHGEMTVPRSTVTKPIRIMQDFVIESLSFNAPGTYRIDIHHNGAPVIEERLYITKI